MARDGLLVIDKPAGPTSHDVVQRVRKALGTRRAGHGGTLDPDATGVLLVALGQATRFFPFLSKEAKSYDGRIRLGFATDTYDASGRPAAEECRDWPGPGQLAEAMRSFEGQIHERARAGEEFTLEPAPVTVTRFGLRAYDPPFVAFEVECSAGTYVRSLAHDLGRIVGCGAHLETLRRDAVGPYRLAGAVPLVALEADAARGEADRHILPVERLLPAVPAAVVLPAAEARVGHGSVLGPADFEDPLAPLEAPLVRLFSVSGRLLALARPMPDRAGLHPFLVLA
jgi:tRNA pseudouridine55 synthase